MKHFSAPHSHNESKRKKKCDEEEKVVYFMLKGFSHFTKMECELIVEIKLCGAVVRHLRAKILE